MGNATYARKIDNSMNIPYAAKNARTLLFPTYRPVARGYIGRPSLLYRTSPSVISGIVVLPPSVGVPDGPQVIVLGAIASPARRLSPYPPGPRYPLWSTFFFPTAFVFALTPFLARGAAFQSGL